MEKIKQSNRKLQIESSKLKKKGQKEQRKIRARDLLMIGLLIEKGGILNFEKEILLGYFMEFKKINSMEYRELQRRGQTLFQIKRNIDDFKELTYMERKEKAHNLISVGALLEIVKLEKEDKNFLLGYFNKLLEVDSYSLTRYFQIGSVELMRRKSERK